MTYHDTENADSRSQLVLASRAARRESGLTEKWEMRGQDDLLLGLRHCWHCGGLHPLDLERMFQENKVVGYSGSDWKYGWPHKFYVDLTTGVPAEHVYTVYPEGFGKDAPTRDVSREEWDAYRGSRGSSIRPGTGDIHAKFYNGHLQDLEAEDFERVALLLHQKFQVLFFYREGKFAYSAPYHDYQAAFPPYAPPEWMKGVDTGGRGVGEPLPEEPGEG